MLPLIGCIIFMAMSSSENDYTNKILLLPQGFAGLRFFTKSRKIPG